MLISELKNKVEWGINTCPGLTLFVSSYLLDEDETFFGMVSLDHVKHNGENLYIIEDALFPITNKSIIFYSLENLKNAIDHNLKKYGDGEVRILYPHYKISTMFLLDLNRSTHDISGGLDTACIYNGTISDIDEDGTIDYAHSVEINVLTDYHYSNIDEFFKIRKKKFDINYKK